MRLLGSRANRWRRSRILPYILTIGVGIVEGVALWGLRTTQGYQRLPGFLAQLGVEMLFLGAALLLYIVLVALVYWPDVKRELKRWRKRGRKR